VLACGDSVETLEAARVMAVEGARGPVVMVRTKADLVGAGAGDDDASAIAVSAMTGTGLDTLLQQVSTLIARGVHLPEGESPVVSHARHRAVLQEAARELKEFHMAWTDQRIPVTVGAVHLRTAVRLLEELIGAVDVDEILGTLFSAFCVGK
jgi:tRNA modification GTPase